MKKLLLGISLLLCATIVHAKTIYPAYVLENIQKIKTTEHYGDELYWVITEFHSNGKNTQYTIPRYPIHWPAKALSQIKNLKLWNGKLDEGQSTIVYVELVEHDAPPFNIDDSVGSVRLVLKNKKGELKVEWQDSENVQKKDIKKDGRRVEELTFHGEDGEYLTQFYFKMLSEKEYRPMKKTSARHSRLLRGK